MTAAPTAFGHPPGYEAGDSAARVVLRSRRQSPDEILAGIFGEPYTRYRDAWRRAASFQERPPFPLHLDVDTNTTCNLKCVMCPAGAGGFHGPFEKKPLPFGVYERALAEAQDHGLRALRLGVTGEPLLRPDIVDMVRLAKKAGILDVMLITNGTLLTPDTGRALIDVGLTRLMVSLDAATAQTYEKIRPGGRFDQVVRNLLGFIDLREQRGSRLPLIRVSFIRMVHNAHEQEAFETYWSGKADYISLQEYANLLERPETGLHAGSKESVPGFRCPDPWTRMSLFSNGDLFPCCSDFGRLAPLGRFPETSLAKAWNLVPALELADIQAWGRWPLSPVCRRCVQALMSGGKG